MLFGTLDANLFRNMLVSRRVIRAGDGLPSQGWT